MTNTPSASTDRTGMESWMQQERDHSRLAADALVANKAALFELLATAGTKSVQITFDGYGDSGQIESVEARNTDQIIPLPPGSIDLTRAVWGKSEVEHLVQPVSEAVETIAYAALEQTHAGWENNDGAYGDFTFDVGERTITLNYNERFTDSEYSQHQF